MQILAATDFSTRSNRALRQAGLLAQRGNAQLYIVHVVDDDRPEEFIRSEKREAERLLSEQTNSMPELKKHTASCEGYCRRSLRRNFKGGRRGERRSCRHGLASKTIA